MAAGLAIFFAIVAGYALAVRRLDARSVTGPAIFLLVGAALGPGGLALLTLAPDAATVRHVVELTLVLLLFADASSVDLQALRRAPEGAERLLLVGLPLTVVLGAVVAWGVLADLDAGTVGLLAAILAPTDLSLGLALFRNPAVPANVRRTLEVESGLNDGIAAPLVNLFVALAIAEGVHSGGWVAGALHELGTGALVGAGVGVAGGRLLALAERRGTTTADARQTAVVAFALVASLAALAVHGNGFVAAFVGGLAFGASAGESRHGFAELAEEIGTLVSLAVWAIFGAFLLPRLLREGLAWRPLLYAVLSLTVVRMLPVAVAYVGSGRRWETRLFVGWFGPRGLASVVFLLLSYDALRAEGVPTATLVTAASWTIVLSVLAHGISAGPAARWYATRARRFAPESPELRPAPAAPAPQRALGAPRARR